MMSSNTNDDPFAKLLNQHKQSQGKPESSINNASERTNNNNSHNNNRSRGRGRGRGRGGHFNRGGHGGRGFKRTREEDPDEIRAKYFSRIKLDTPEDLAKWIADRKKNFPGRADNNEDNQRPNNPLGLIQDYSSSDENDEEKDEGIDNPKLITQSKEQNTRDNVVGENQIEKDTDIDESYSNNPALSESTQNLENECQKPNNIDQDCDNDEDEDEDEVEAPEFQTSHQTFQPPAQKIYQPHKAETTETTEDVIICKFYSNGQRCFKGQKCPYLHTKVEKQKQPNPRPNPSQYKRKDLINLLQAQDIEKDSEIILQSLRYLYNNGCLN